MISFPFDSHVTYDSNGENPTFDRAISSEPYRLIFRELFKTGVMPTDSTNFQVTAGSTGMTLNVAKGFAMVNGCMSLETTARTLTLQAADENFSRIDTVVLRLDTSEEVRSCDLAILKGTAKEVPTRPTLTRTVSVYEIGLADILVEANATTITNSKITDTRLETARCGVISSVSQFDTTSLYNQVQADLAEFKTESEADFTEFVESIKDWCDEETATSLFLEMQEVKKSVADGKEAVADAISGKGVTTATDATFEVMAANIDAIQLGSGNATAADVLAPKTFSADAGTDLTGTMPDYSSTTLDASAVTKDDTKTYFAVPNAGYYDTNSKISTLNSNLAPNVELTKDNRYFNTYMTLVRSGSYNCKTTSKKTLVYMGGWVEGATGNASFSADGRNAIFAESYNFQRLYLTEYNAEIGTKFDISFNSNDSYTSIVFINDFKERTYVPLTVNKGSTTRSFSLDANSEYILIMGSWKEPSGITITASKNNTSTVLSELSRVNTGNNYYGHGIYYVKTASTDTVTLTTNGLSSYTISCGLKLS